MEHGRVALVIEYSVIGPVATVTLQRTQRRNALDRVHCEQLRARLLDARADGARVVVLAAAGPVFCSGADLDAVYDEPFRQALGDLLATLSSVGVPVVAALTGPAIGAGVQLALAADLRVAAPAATLSVPTARLGLAVDRWTVGRLRALAGTGVAGRMLLAAEPIEASSALACGLVDRVAEDALAAARDWAAQLAAWAPLSLAYAKAALREQPGDPAAALDDAFARCWASQDAQEARAARIQRREPRFTGR